MDDGFSNIMSAVATSDLNIAMVSCLNHAEFLVLDPIKCPITGKPHSKSSKMLDNYGIWAMAHIAYAGMATFDYDLLRRVKMTSKVRGTVIKKEREESADDEVECINSDFESCEVGSLASKITILEHDQSLPSIDDIYSLLKQAISNIDNTNLELLQSILKDVLVLQPWTRNLDGSEEKTLYRMENVVNKSRKVINLTEDTTEISDDDMQTIAKVNFSALPSTHAGSTKKPVNLVATPVGNGGNAKKSSNTDSTAKKIGDQDEQRSAQRKTPTSMEKKSQENERLPLQQSFAPGDYSDTDEDEEYDGISTATAKGAMKSVADKQNSSFNDDDDDDDDFEGMFLYLYNITNTYCITPTTNKHNYS